MQVRLEAEPSGNKPPGNGRHGPLIPARWVFVSGLGLSGLVLWISPTSGTLLLLGGALLLLGLALSLQRLAARARFLSAQLRPEFVLAAVTTCATLALAEIALRLFLFQSFPDFNRMTRVTLGYEHDSRLGWSPVPNSQRTFGTGSRTITISNNSNGLRDPEPVIDSRPGIVFLGDSFVWGYDLDADERFTEKLRARHPEWRIYNFGVVGYGTDQEYLLLQQHFEAYRPRLVFVIFCTENDHMDNSGNGRSEWTFKPYFSVEAGRLRLHGVPVPRSDWVFCREHPILSKPYLVRLAVRAWGNLRSPVPRVRKDPTNNILEALKRYSADRGAAFCVGLTRKDTEVEQFLKASKIPYLDLSTDLLLKGDWHWSAEGNSFVAHQIEQFLCDQRFAGLSTR